MSKTAEFVLGERIAAAEGLRGVTTKIASYVRNATPQDVLALIVKTAGITPVQLVDAYRKNPRATTIKVAQVVKEAAKPKSGPTPVERARAAAGLRPKSKAQRSAQAERPTQPERPVRPGGIILDPTGQAITLDPPPAQVNPDKLWGERAWKRFMAKIYNRDLSDMLDTLDKPRSAIPTRRSKAPGELVLGPSGEPVAGAGLRQAKKRRPSPILWHPEGRPIEPSDLLKPPIPADPRYIKGTEDNVLARYRWERQGTGRVRDLVRNLFEQPHVEGGPGHPIHEFASLAKREGYSPILNRPDLSTKLGPSQNFSERAWSKLKGLSPRTKILAGLGALGSGAYGLSQLGGSSAPAAATVAAPEVVSGDPRSTLMRYLPAILGTGALGLGGLGLYRYLSRQNEEEPEGIHTFPRASRSRRKAAFDLHSEINPDVRQEGSPREQAARLVSFYIDELAADAPFSKQAEYRLIQAHLAMNRPLHVAVKAACPGADDARVEAVCKNLVKGACALQREVSTLVTRTR